MTKLLAPFLLIVLLIIVGVTVFGVPKNINLPVLFSRQSVAAATISPVQMGMQAGQPIDDEGNILLTSSVIKRMAESGAVWVRVNFRLGPYNADTPQFYSTYDKIINNLQSQGLQVIGLASNESWPGSQRDWTANNFENTGKDGYNNYIDQFGYALTRMAKHYEGKIAYWEVWNEPNTYSSNPSAGVYQGGTFIYPSNFAAMLAHVYSQINLYNHINVKLISGGLFGHNMGGLNPASSGESYLNSAYDMGINKTGKFAWSKATIGTYPLDAVGQHLYLDQGRSLDALGFGSYLDNIHKVVTRWEGATSPKKTWITEFGWDNKSVNESVQSDNLSSALTVINSKNYIAGAVWFQLDDNPYNDMRYGLYRLDFSKKPSWTVFNNNSLRQTNVGKTAAGSVIIEIANYYNANGGIGANGTAYDNGGSVYAHQWDFGYVQDFKGGSVGPNIIFDTGHRVQQGFWAMYVSGNNHMLLKFPLSEAYWDGKGVRQDFQGGYMTWDPVNNVRVYEK